MRSLTKRLIKGIEHLMTKNTTNKTEVAYSQLEKMIIFRELEPGSMVSEKQL